MNADEEPALDPAVLGTLRQLNQPGEPDVLHEVLGLFLADAPARLEAMRAAVSSGHAPDVQRAAHALKGAAGTIGAFRLQRVCRELEELGKAGTLDGAAGRLDAVRHEYAQVESAIGQILSPP